MRVGYWIGHIQTLGTLTAFVAIGYFGHQTHWRFRSAPPVEQNSKSSEAPQTKDSSLLSGQSSQALSESGIAAQPAEARQVREIVPAMATVTYNEQRYSQVATRADGHVQHVFVRVGQAVKKGDVLALVDSQTVGESKSSWLQAAVTARYQQQLLQQLTSDGADGAIAKARIRSVEAQTRDAELTYFIAQQRLNNLGFEMNFELDPELNASKMADQVRLLGIPEKILAQLPERPSTANLIAIQAPFDGVVVEQHAVPGEMVTGEDYQFVVADTSTMWLKLSVRREDAMKLSVGQEVEFAADGIDRPISTRLAWIEPEIDEETKTVQAGCEVLNSLAVNMTPSTDVIAPSLSEHRVLQANQFGTAKICVAQRQNAVLVPEAAVQRMPDQSNVAFVSSHQSQPFEKRNISLGARQNGFVEIVDGILAGEMVVSEGSFILKSELMRASLVGG